jgi:hypothetical protein
MTEMHSNGEHIHSCPFCESSWLCDRDDCPDSVVCDKCNAPQKVARREYLRTQAIFADRFAGVTLRLPGMDDLDLAYAKMRICPVWRGRRGVHKLDCPRGGPHFEQIDETEAELAADYGFDDFTGEPSGC